MHRKEIHIQGVPPISTQLRFQFSIFLIFLSKKTSFANLQNSKNWVIFFHVEKNCSKKKIDPVLPPMSCNNSSIHTIFSSSFFWTKMMCDCPIFLFQSVSTPHAEGLIEVGWWWAIYATIAATVWVVFSTQQCCYWFFISF